MQPPLDPAEVFHRCSPEVLIRYGLQRHPTHGLRDVFQALRIYKSSDEEDGIVEEVAQGCLDDPSEWPTWVEPKATIDLLHSDAPTRVDKMTFNTSQGPVAFHVTDVDPRYLWSDLPTPRSRQARIYYRRCAPMEPHSDGGRVILPNRHDPSEVDRCLEARYRTVWGGIIFWVQDEPEPNEPRQLFLQTTEFGLDRVFSRSFVLHYDVKEIDAFAKSVADGQYNELFPQPEEQEMNPARVDLLGDTKKPHFIVTLFPHEFAEFATAMNSTLSLSQSMSLGRTSTASALGL